MTTISLSLLIAATLGSGLMAGLFASFSNFMMKALASISPPRGIAAMQAINQTIVRPAFLAVFLGTGVLGFLAVLLGWAHWGLEARAWGLSGSIVYVLGSIGVTIAFNVPLNDRLAEIDADSGAGSKMWEIYLREWTRWNHLRSLATLGSTLLLILAGLHAHKGG